MKIALISTDSDQWNLGIRLISAIIKSAGYQSRLIFLNSEDNSYPKNIIDKTKELLTDVDVVGVGCYSRGADRATQLIRSIRSLNKLIIWGGLHATLNPELCAKEADIVCRGEGEDVILELLQTLKGGENWEDISNLVFEKNGKLVKNPIRPLIDDLDKLPLYDFDRFDEYHQKNEKIVKIGPSDDITDKGQIFFIGSRGCAFRCTYCCNLKLKQLYSGKGKYLRKISINRYIEHLEVLSKKHFPNAHHFCLLDEDFFARSMSDFQQFSEIYPERVGLPFECCGSAPKITNEKMKLLSDTGLWRIRMGVESGSERTKRVIYDRPIRNEMVRKAAQIIRTHPHIVPCYLFIIANPYEEKSDLTDTINEMTKLKYPYYAQMFNLVFFPGSVLYDKAIEDKIISGIQDSGYELHFRRGLHYEKHEWKKKNLYLNGLLFLAEGKVTFFRMGLLPRFLLPILLKKFVIKFCDKNTWIVKFMINLKFMFLFVRGKIGGTLKAKFNNPGGLYNLPFWLKNQLKNAF